MFVNNLYDQLVRTFNPPCTAPLRSGTRPSTPHRGAQEDSMYKLFSATPVATLALALMGCGGFPTDVATVRVGDTGEEEEVEVTPPPIGDVYAYCMDADGDSWGNPMVCELLPEGTQPAGWVNNSLDCNDQNPSVHPGAAESDNGLDDDCDGTVDEGFTATAPGTDTVDDPTDTVDPPFVDEDGDGYGLAPYDCDDSDPDINPGAPEICDGVDNDCDGLADDADPGAIEDCDAPPPPPAAEFVLVTVTRDADWLAGEVWELWLLNEVDWTGCWPGLDDFVGGIDLIPSYCESGSGNSHSGEVELDLSRFFFVNGIGTADDYSTSWLIENVDGDAMEHIASLIGDGVNYPISLTEDDTPVPGTCTRRVGLYGLVCNVP